MTIPTTIPTIELQLVQRKTDSRWSTCSVCDRQMIAGVLASRVPPKWTHRFEFLYTIWSIALHLFGYETSSVYHRDCVPEGWQCWTVQMSEDANVYHSEDVEDELIKQFASHD